MIRSALWCAIALMTAMACGGMPSAQALTAKECSAKYKAAQQAGTLNGMKWNDFRKAECGSTTPQAAASPATAPSHPAPAAKQTPAPIGNAVFPTAGSSKYSSESPGKARMHTCLDQYHANKDNNGNGGLKWIQKGGGYYSECSKRLKGVS